jgi:hypothetical protein
VPGCHARAQYVPRSTQESDALALVREHWRAFRERFEERAGSLPAFVREELEAFVTCGDFEHGFLLAECGRWAGCVSGSPRGSCRRFGGSPSERTA